MRFKFRVEANSNGTVTIGVPDEHGGDRAEHVMVPGETWEKWGLTFTLSPTGAFHVSGATDEEETVPWRCSACKRMIPDEGHADGCAYVAERMRELEAVNPMTSPMGKIKFLRSEPGHRFGRPDGIQHEDPADPEAR